MYLEVHACLLFFTLLYFTTLLTAAHTATVPSAGALARTGAAGAGRGHQSPGVTYFFVFYLFLHIFYIPLPLQQHGYIPLPLQEHCLFKSIKHALEEAVWI
jgi:hypothetical protein